MLHIPNSLEGAGSLKLKSSDGNSNTDKNLNNGVRINDKQYTCVDTRWKSICSDTSEITNVMITHKSQKRKICVELSYIVSEN